MNIGLNQAALWHFRYQGLLLNCRLTNANVLTHSSYKPDQSITWSLFWKALIASFQHVLISHWKFKWFKKKHMLLWVVHRYNFPCCPLILTFVLFRWRLRNRLQQSRPGMNQIKYGLSTRMAFPWVSLAYLFKNVLTVASHFSPFHCLLLVFYKKLHSYLLLNVFFNISTRGVYVIFYCKKSVILH